MANANCRVLLTDAPLNVPQEEMPLEVGGIVDFWGVVRQTEDGRPISGLAYEAHATMAEHQLCAIAGEGNARFDLMHVLVMHRIGFVAVGEASLLVRVCSKHRAEAFRACSWIVDELKKRVPIWKHPRFDETARSGTAVAAAPSSV